MILLALDMMTPTHQSFGLWRHPEADVEQYRDLDFWAAHARMLEEAGFDALFFADVAGVYDVYGGDGRTAIAAGMQYPTLDPLLVVSALARETTTLGIAVTASVSYESPYLLARKFATLDHLTRGRIGWNVVNSYQRSAMRNVAGTDLLPHDERYDRADEFMDVVYDLWESSAPEEALVRDAASNAYLDADRIRPIDHEGLYFRVPGPATTLAGPQGTPFLFQAGSSPRGVDFALRHAEAIFVSGTSRDNVARLVRSIEARAAELGRDRASFRIVCSITVIAAATDAEARERHASYLELIDREAALALFAGWTGIDLSAYAPDDALEEVHIEGNRSALQSFTSMDPARTWTVADLAEFMAIGARGAVLVGSGETVAREMQDWLEETGLDGFIVDYGIRDVDLRAFARHVSPALRERGLIRPAEAAEPTTLRRRLVGADHLRPDHAGRRPAG